MGGIICVSVRKTVLNVLTGSKTFMGIHTNRNVPSRIIPRRADVTTSLCDITYKALNLCKISRYALTPRDGQTAPGRVQ